MSRQDLINEATATVKAMKPAPRDTVPLNHGLHVVDETRKPKPKKRGVSRNQLRGKEE